MPLALMSMFTMIYSFWDCPLQEVPHCSLCWTITHRFVDITHMFLRLSLCWLLLVTMAANLILSLSPAMSLLALLLVLFLVLHMTWYPLEGLLLAGRHGGRGIHCSSLAARHRHVRLKRCE